MSNNKLIALLERILTLTDIQVETTNNGIGIRVVISSIPHAYTVAKYSCLSGQKKGDLHIAGHGFEWVDHVDVWRLLEVYEKIMEEEAIAAKWLNEQLAQR